jgi:hypothetical protein
VPRGVSCELLLAARPYIRAVVASFAKQISRRFIASRLRHEHCCSAKQRRIPIRERSEEDDRTYSSLAPVCVLSRITRRWTEGGHLLRRSVAELFWAHGKETRVAG